MAAGTTKVADLGIDTSDTKSSKGDVRLLCVSGCFAAESCSKHTYKRQRVRPQTMQRSFRCFEAGELVPAGAGDVVNGREVKLP